MPWVRKAALGGLRQVRGGFYVGCSLDLNRLKVGLVDPTTRQIGLEQSDGVALAPLIEPLRWEGLTSLPLIVGREKSIATLNEASKADKVLFLAARHEARTNQPEPSDILHKRETYEMVTRELTAVERRLVDAYYFKGLTLKDIGKKEGISESRVCQLHSRIIERLRERLDRLRADLMA